MSGRHPGFAGRAHPRVVYDARGDVRGLRFDSVPVLHRRQLSGGGRIANARPSWRVVVQAIILAALGGVIFAHGKAMFPEWWAVVTIVALAVPLGLFQIAAKNRWWPE